MNKNLVLSAAFLIVSAFGWQSVSAQITITIPKMPKAKKSKTESTDTAETTPNNKQTSQPTEQKNTSQVSTVNDKMDFRLVSFLDDIATAQKAVDAYTPEEKTYLVADAEYDWLVRAVSMREREEWGKKWLKKPNDKKIFDEALDRLAASAAKKLPLYQANPKIYNFRNAAEEKMMKGELENLATLKIYKIGLNQNNWLISKDNYGLPTSRYKHGMLWVRNTADDHAFCRIYYVNIIQDYAGGGTYGASYAQYTGGELAGCPAVNTK